MRQSPVLPWLLYNVTLGLTSSSVPQSARNSNLLNGTANLTFQGMPNPDRFDPRVPSYRINSQRGLDTAKTISYLSVYSVRIISRTASRSPSLNVEDFTSIQLDVYVPFSPPTGPRVAELNGRQTWGFWETNFEGIRLSDHQADQIIALQLLDLYEQVDAFDLVDQSEGPGGEH